MLQLFILFRHLLMLFLRSFILDSTFIFFGFSFRSFFYYWCQLYFSSLLVFNSFRNLMFYDLFILESTFLLLGFGFRIFFIADVNNIYKTCYNFQSLFFNSFRNFWCSSYHLFILGKTFLLFSFGFRSFFITDINYIYMTCCNFYSLCFWINFAIFNALPAIFLS